jgi:hypothetical protein
MIDHHEQHCRQILIDELEVARPSLAVWASAEFDAGASAAELRRALFMVSPEAMTLYADTKDFADCIQRDETGDLIGNTFTGNGNGGNLSTPSLRAKGKVQRDINDIKQLLHPSGKEG